MAFIPCDPADIVAGKPTKQEIFEILCGNSDDHETRVAALEALIAVTTVTGGVLEFGGASAPTGWHLCDGTVLDKTVEVALFAVIGTTFNQPSDTGDDFRVPDKRGKVGMGVNDGTLTNGEDTGYTTRNLGDGSPIASPTTVEQLGEELHVHAMPHVHTVQAHNHAWYVNNNATTDDTTFDSIGATRTISDGVLKTPVFKNFIPRFFDSVTTPARGITSTTMHTDSQTPNTGEPSNANTNSNQTVQPSLVMNYIIKL